MSSSPVEVLSEQRSAMPTATHLVKKAGHPHRTSSTVTVIFIQCFGNTLNQNIKFRAQFLNIVYALESAFH
jgi:hypothetical protein